MCCINTPLLEINKTYYKTRRKNNYFNASIQGYSVDGQLVRLAWLWAFDSCWATSSKIAANSCKQKSSD